MNRLEISHLGKRYGDQTVVEDLCFHVDAGEIFGLIGPNGAGKSTSLMMIVGLLEADAGSISFDGHHYDPRDPQMRSQFGLVPQEVAIYPDLTAIQNLRLFGRLNGLRGRRLQERIDSVLELSGLVEHKHQVPRTFSGGMSRRLNFGIALLHEPSFVVLDEPTVGIDPHSRARLLDAVRDLGRNGVGVLYASHHMEEVEAVCHRVAIMDRGRLLKLGTLDQLLDRTKLELCITVPLPPPQLVAKLEDLADVREEPDRTLRIVIQDRLQNQPAARMGRLCRILELLENAGIKLLGIASHEQSLETLFLGLTGRTLRD